MAQTIATFDTAHAGMLHDAQLDYYGKRLATSSSDHTIRLWDVSGETPSFIAELQGHSSPVWQVCWSHPKFGNILASCSYDKKVIIWKEVKPNDWQIAYKCEEHSASVNSVAWAPWEYGLHLAAASSDGTVSVLSFNGYAQWTCKTFLAHANGVNAVSWSNMQHQTNPTATGAHQSLSTSSGSGGSSAPHIVTGGCDNQIRIWRLEESHGEWIETFQLCDNPHTDWVRDVAWRPSVGVPTNTIASCSEDQTLKLWTQSMEGSPWKHTQTIPMGGPVWRVSWSITGSILAVASGDSRVTLFKDSVDGVWEKVTNLSDAKALHAIVNPDLVNQLTNGAHINGSVPNGTAVFDESSFTFQQPPNNQPNTFGNQYGDSQHSQSANTFGAPPVINGAQLSFIHPPSDRNNSFLQQQQPQQKFPTPQGFGPPPMMYQPPGGGQPSANAQPPVAPSHPSVGMAPPLSVVNPPPAWNPNPGRLPMPVGDTPSSVLPGSNVLHPHGPPHAMNGPQMAPPPSMAGPPSATAFPPKPSFNPGEMPTHAVPPPTGVAPAMMATGGVPPPHLAGGIPPHHPYGNY